MVADLAKDFIGARQGLIEISGDILTANDFELMTAPKRLERLSANATQD